MRTSGYIFMFIAWGAILALTVYCFYKILKSNNKEQNTE